MQHRLGKVEANGSNRRSFIGGSDARIIMGMTRPPCFAFGRKNGAKSNRKTSPATSSSSSAWLRKS
jgi:hypothetical protein